jgi:3-oxoacyl-[acyl-carrier-protein] synthase-3
MKHAAVIGIGSYLPERRLTNADLERMVETSDEWIYSRTGIRERRIVAEGEATSDLAARAGDRARDCRPPRSRDVFARYGLSVHSQPGPSQDGPDVRGV